MSNLLIGFQSSFVQSEGFIWSKTRHIPSAKKIKSYLAF